jgi:hypothetical protein
VFLRLKISNFNTPSNLITLAEYRGSQLKPDHQIEAGPSFIGGRRWTILHHAVERGVAFGSDCG